MSFYNFKRIGVVPTATDFIDIVLSKTQRKTPTVVRKNFQISRIRAFYLRKVKFTRESFEEKLSAIVQEFPKLEDIHPFYSDLINVLYDRDHYKLALAQIHTAKHLIDNVAKDYLKLLKYGDSLYRCKQLKRAALGRMATIMKRQKDSLAYLEQVRQHLARLPSIDPTTRTLLVCGYPNVGKSSFMNKMTRAEVEVQPYAFTTKSLFVGHMDYKYQRWQVIDTPGILDHPLEERNTIEMQSITALAHLRACVLYFIDVSEQCGYTIAQQVALFHSIKPLFSGKPLVVVANKVDIVKPEDLPEEKRALVQSMLSDEVKLLTMSCITDEGINNVKTLACDILLAHRVEAKLRSKKMDDVLNKLHLSVPVARDNVERPAFIPEAALMKKKYDPNDPNRRKLEKDLEVEAGGAGVYSVDLKKHYMLPEDWRYDVIPEIMDGKNVADFVDPEIESRLLALEAEEEERDAREDLSSEEDEGDDDMDMMDVDGGQKSKKADVLALAKQIRDKKKLLIDSHRREKGKNRSSLPRKIRALSMPSSEIEERLSKLGHDHEALERARSQTRKRRRGDDEDGMDMDDSGDSENEGVAIKKMAAATSRERSLGRTAASRDRSSMGLRNIKAKIDVERFAKVTQREKNLDARKGEADRKILNMRPKHLLSGKRKMGSTSHR